MTQSGADRDPIHLKAVEWFVRLKNPSLPMEEIQAWQAWMSDDPRHLAAFARFEELSSLLSAVPLPERPSSSRAKRDTYDGSVPIRDWRPRQHPSRWLALAAMTVAVSFGLVLMGLSSGSWTRHPQVYATRIGENELVQLADGSAVTLGGDSRIEVSLDKHNRTLELTRGEAYFTVARDPTRPFTVRAGSATILAVGTSFNIHRTADRVSVAVIEGRVLVRPVTPLLSLWPPRQNPVQLDGGQETTATAAGVDTAIHHADLFSVTGWRSGRLAFRMQPLRRVLEDVNRYARKPIVIGADGIADVPVTGTVVGGNVSGWLASLASVLGISVEEDADKIVLRKGHADQG